jgi:hypothetical protein
LLAVVIIINVMQRTFEIEDGERQKMRGLNRLLDEGWRVITTTKIDYGRTTVFILERF